MVGEELKLRVVPSPPCDLDFAWYEMIRDELLGKTVPAGSCVLDVGCGRGEVLLMLSEQVKSGTGIGVSEDDIAAAERARKDRCVENVEFHLANAADLPFPDASFDVVLCLGDVLCYSNLFGKKDRVLAEIRRVLRVEGVAVHDCMNWEWEYRTSPYWTHFSRAGPGRFQFSRVKRTASGIEVSRNYEVLGDTPLHEWLLQQSWPASPQGHNTSLDVAEERRIPRRCLKYLEVSKHQHFTPHGLRRAYMKAGFRELGAFSYGQTYDIASKAGLLENLKDARPALAKAEAELALQQRTGSGPWLFLIARK